MAVPFYNDWEKSRFGTRESRCGSSDVKLEISIRYPSRSSHIGNWVYESGVLRRGLG